VTPAEAKKTLDDLIEDAEGSGEPIFVTRRGEHVAVLLPISEYNSMQETLHLLSSPKNAERLRRSIADIEAGRVIEHEIPDE
jgi:antitoxin YefM